MNRRNFISIGCCFPVLGLSRGRPTPADPVPDGYEIIDRTMVGKREWVIFRNLRLRRFRIYINGKFHSESPTPAFPIDLKHNQAIAKKGE